MWTINWDVVNVIKGKNIKDDTSIANDQETLCIILPM